ncbi:MAG: globin-coupled sensor protein [Alphaproteobacteria bacterium]|nr:globin-coupled sensor protein [Rhodospirillales bacterium]MCW9045159.1 globin-coupled sensor protein [Alphaproteobacteria bacterium]
MQNIKNIHARLKFLRIDDSTSVTLKEFTPIVEKNIEPIMDSFYEYITTDPSLAHFFVDDAIKEHAKSAQKKHWLSSIFSGNFDTSYVESAVRIARTHERIGLSPEFYLGGYEFAHESIIALAVENFSPTLFDYLTFRSRGKKKKLTALLQAVDRAIFLDIGLVIDVYFAEVQKTSAKVLNDLAEEFEIRVGTVVTSVTDSAGEMKLVASTMSAAAEESSQQAAMVANAAEEASSNVETVAVASQQLAASIKEISEQVDRSTVVATEAVEQAENTNEIVDSLAKMVNKIGEIVKMINEIAEQTNLLALNATIESARAGDAGKGFAVVASEVKGLAQQTAKATDEIATQIRGVQAATGSSVNAIKNISDTISNIQGIATVIASAVEEQGAATEEISRNVHEAANGTTQVTENISGVSTAANQTGEASVMVLESADQLTVKAGELDEEVSSFLNGMRNQTKQFIAA